MRKILAALVISLFALSQSSAGTERVDNSDKVKVLVFSTPTPGKWYSRVALVHKFDDAIIVACFEWKNSVQAECLVLVQDGDTLMVPVRLLEIKT